MKIQFNDIKISLFTIDTLIGYEYINERCMFVKFTVNGNEC